MVKNLPANAGDIEDTSLIRGLGRSPGVGNGILMPIFLLDFSHGQRSLAGWSAWGRKESDMTKQPRHAFGMHLC